MSCKRMQLSKIGAEVESDRVLKYVENTIESLYLDLKNYCNEEISGETVIESIDEYLFQKICIELEYCKNKSRFTYMNTKSLAGLLLINLDEIPKYPTIPKSLLVAILIKTGLDRFCKC